ncbi:MAG: PASTA domain-containing protein, partial [Erysipelotrichia bacterium]|nr:PASTA domain-containing protein [Erysipelotrichia bacterium]
MDDVSSWAKQNQISNSAIATTSPEYSMDYDSGVIVKQSLSEGTLIKKDTPISITLSQGPNPNDALDFPDIKSMTQSEITDWIANNKLLKTKVTTQYSTIVANGGVISYDLKNTAETDFTRGSSLSIVCSKGPAPTGQVTVENYVGKTYSELQTWASNKKVMLNKQSEFSTNVEADRIISQSVAAGQTMNEGDTLTVVVSKGKGVIIPNLVGYTKTQLEAWIAGAGKSVTVIPKTVYSSSLVGTVLAQDVPAGSQVESGTVLTLTTSLYLPIMETTSNQWLGKDFMELKNWVDEANANGASIQAGEYGDYQYSECSDTYKTPGMIIAYACIYGTSDSISNGCTRPLTTSSRIAYKV